MTDRYDAIVLGIGEMGAATVAHLAERGATVLGLERDDVPRGDGSAGTRLIRRAYERDPAYVSLRRRADELWTDLEAGHDRRLTYETGSIQAGPAGSDRLEKTRRACEEYGLEYESLSSATLSDRYPGFQLPETYEAVYQPDGGFLASQQCTVAHVERAHDAGATIRARERVVGWQSTGDGGVAVDTDHARYEADNLVVTAGAWASKFVDELEGIVVPDRQVLARLQPEVPESFEPKAHPVWTLQVPEGRFYGFPVHDVPGFEFGRCNRREAADSPRAFEREPTQADERLLREFAEEYFPDGAGPTMGLQTRLSTSTPDGNFVLDTLADHPQVAVGAGFSGHGATFATAVGEVLADLALEGETEHDIETFSLDRF